MKEMFFVVGPLGFISFVLASLGFMGAKSRLGAMSLVTGIFTALTGLVLLLVMIAVAVKSKDFFEVAFIHLSQLTLFVTLIMMGVLGLTSVARASKGLGVSLGILSILAGLVVVTTWIMAIAEAGESALVMRMIGIGLAAIVYIMAGITLIKARKL